MTSLQSHIVQIPRNSHFRPIPSLAGSDAGTFSTGKVLYFVPASGVAPLLTYNSATVGVSGSFSNAPWTVYNSAASGGVNAYGLLSSGQGLLKDLGDTIVSSGRTFRRIQLLNPSTIVTEQNGGVYTGSTSTDYDALTGYIELGLRGVGSAGPFIRAL